MLQELDMTKELTVNRRDVVRRALTKRRIDSGEQVNSKVAESGKVERRKVERRRQIDPTTCERDYSGDEVAFMRAMDDYKRRSGRQFPTWSEVLEVLKDMGYRKIADPMTTFTPETETKK